MSGSRSFSLILAFLLLCFCSETGTAKEDDTSTKSCTSSCGHIHNISYPFRLNNDPKHCGDVMYTLSCENNITVLHLPYSGKYYVQAISDDNHIIRLLDPGLENNNCSSMPQNLLPGISDSSPFSFLSPSIYYLKCQNPVNSSLYLDTDPCLNNTSATSYSYVMVVMDNPSSWSMITGYLDDGCSVESMALALFNQSTDDNINASSYQYIHNALMDGFELFVQWPEIGCKGKFWSWDWYSYHTCFPHSISGFFQSLWHRIVIDGIWIPHWLRSWFYSYSSVPELGILMSIGYQWGILLNIGFFFLARFVFGVLVVTAFLIYTWRRRHLSMFNTIEDFLQCDNNFMPIRYSYSDIKKMTRKFKDKLGEGGYGSVFKGKLRSGRFVAVKVLGKPKADGQDFISEIATIGRIHHANVVHLVGYCVEGSKRALVYDFMPNGSLDKYIYSKEGSFPLTIKNMYEISLGVAQGIEYLHEGCEMKILHFDIKPHNILLDENFKAKVSDFGLAKLYPVDNSIVSLMAARGTMGYIAPELFYKNIGGVSYKADVYSFGMLLMEMASRRKNWKATVEHSSQIFFPLWAYNQYTVGNDLEMDNVTEEEKKVIRKMVITALWCIQMKPSDRPSMSKVIKMLGGDVECLQMPLRPSLCPQETHVTMGDIQDNKSNPICSNTELTCSLSAR